MKRVYIASPYWHEDPAVRLENVTRQIYIANGLADLGYAPFWPLSSHFLAQKGIGRHVSEAAWLSLSVSWITACDYMIRIPLPSKGADAEEAHAKALGIPVFENITELILYDMKGGETDA